MRPARRHVLVALLAAAALAAPAQGATVADVYADYAGDGRLDGAYPATVLEEVVEDATVFQYGDPLTASRLRRVVRQTLAAGTPVAATPPAAAEPASGGSAETGADGSGSEGAQAAVPSGDPGGPDAGAGGPGAADDRTADASAAVASPAGASAGADAGAAAGAVTPAATETYAVTPLTILLGIAAIGFGAGAIAIVVRRAQRTR